MLDSRSITHHPRRRAAHPVARAVLALLCLLSLVGGASPVFCFERDGGCSTEEPAAPGTTPCHDQAPGGLTACGSCKDVLAPEESLLRAHRQDHEPDLPIASLPPARQAGVARLRAAHPVGVPLPRVAAVPGFARTTVLLI